MRPTVLTAALVLVACGTDRRAPSSEPGAASPSRRGPDAVLLRVARAGGPVVAYVYPNLDSAVTVSCYNMWSPVRARRIDADGLLQPFVPFEAFGDPATLTCDRDSQGDVWFADMGLSVVRPHCLERLEDGVLPQRWMGRRIHPIKQWGGLDVDYEWQIPLVEHWLRAHGVVAAREDCYECSRA